MRKLFVGFLVLSSCASRPVATKFDAQWEMVEVIPGETRACLDMAGVKKLREILIRCRSPEVNK